MRDSLAAILLLVGSTLFLAGMTLAAPIDTNRTVAAVFPPWFNHSEMIEAIARADALMVRNGGFDMVALVRLHSPEGTQKLKDAGAWAVVSPEGLVGCVGLKNGVARLIFQKES